MKLCLLASASGRYAASLRSEATLARTAAAQSVNSLQLHFYNPTAPGTGTSLSLLLVQYSRIKKPQLNSQGQYVNSGGDLLSHTVASAVPSALLSLTSVFEMGTGGSSTLTPPEIFYNFNYLGWQK